MILTNGCSFTNGYDLNNINDNWPSQLSVLLNQQVINLALGGASNDRIFRTTKEWLVNNEPPEYVIIGWTSHTRNELHHELGMYCRTAATGIEQENGPDPGNLKKLHRFWIHNMFNEYINYRNWIYNILFLQDYFESKNIRYTFFNAFTPSMISDFIEGKFSAMQLADLARHNRKTNTDTVDPSNTTPEFIELQKLCTQVNLSNWLIPDSHLMEYVCNLGYKQDSQGHFYADGYQAWAQYLTKYIVDNKIV
tara:strand:+ start:6274 stop:7026 length:753 start_codon:yes stop_codon:yes gene_type:complete